MDNTCVSSVADGGQLSYLEFFAGSGLVAEGFKDIFRPVWANDVSAKKAAIYAANHNSRHFHLGSIVDVRGRDLPEADLAWASFPCQDLSLAGATEGINGSRSGLVWQWLRVIDEMRRPPPVLVAENVSGLISADGGKHYQVLHRALADRAFNVGAVVIDAARWVPQSRPRVFVVAVRQECVLPEGLTCRTPTWLHTEGIRRVSIGLNKWVWWYMPQPPVRMQTLSDIIEWTAPFADADTEARNVRLISRRHATLLEALPKRASLALPAYRRTRNGNQVLELRFDGVAGCLRTPEGGSSRQWLIFRRGEELRSRLLTVREAARLMGAPDTYKIPGTYNDGYKAMGDAVVVPVVRWLAKELLQPLVASHAFRVAESFGWWEKGTLVPTGDRGKQRRIAAPNRPDS